MKRRLSSVARLSWTLGPIAGAWGLADIGYYFLLPVLGVQPNYNDGAVEVTLYYSFWVGIAIIAFWPRYASWSKYSNWATFENRLTSLIVWSLAFGAAVAFAAYVLPTLPPFNPRLGSTPPDLPLATPSYFLPKSIEILFQQLLVVALVLGLSAENFSLRSISLCCAITFGGAHVLLAFGDVSWAYVVRFSVLATLFGIGFPYLILRVPNGFAYSYILHWGYYATTVVMARTLGAGAISELVNKVLDQL